MYQWGGRNNSEIVRIEDIPRSNSGPQNSWYEKIPDPVEQADEFNSQCAINRLLRLAQFDIESNQTKNLSWFLNNTSAPNTYSYALSCIFGSNTISQRFCDDDNLRKADAVDLVFRMIEAQFEQSNFIYRGSGYRVSEDYERRNIWLINIELAKVYGDEFYLREIYLAAAQDLKDRELFLTAASLHDPYLFQNQNREKFFGIFVEAIKYLYEDSDYVSSDNSRITSLFSRYFDLYIDTGVNRLTGTCAEGIYRGDCFDGEILPQVQAVLQRKSHVDVLAVGDRISNAFVSNFHEKFDVCRRYPGQTFSNGGLRGLRDFQSQFLPCPTESIANFDERALVGNLIDGMRDLMNIRHSDDIVFSRFQQSAPPRNLFDLEFDRSFIEYWRKAIQPDWSKTRIIDWPSFDCERPNKIEQSHYPYQDIDDDKVYYEECLTFPQDLVSTSRARVISARNLGSIYATYALGELTINNSYAAQFRLNYRTFLPIQRLFPSKEIRYDGYTGNRSLKWLKATMNIYSMN